MEVNGINNLSCADGRPFIPTDEKKKRERKYVVGDFASVEGFN